MEPSGIVILAACLTLSYVLKASSNCKYNTFYVQM